VRFFPIENQANSFRELRIRLEAFCHQRYSLGHFQAQRACGNGKVDPDERGFWNSEELWRLVGQKELKGSR
jgi:hypothetical protein